MATNAVTRLTVAALGTSAAVAVATGGASPAAVLLGMLGPLAAAVGSWIVLARTHARAPDQVSAALIRLFGAKLVLFALFVSLIVVLLPAGRVVFVVSFVANYVLLHALEALYLRRLFTGGGRPVGIS